MRLSMACFNGMCFNVIDSGATHADLKALADRRRKQGYEVTWLDPMTVEVNSDDLVDDYMGTLSLRREVTDKDRRRAAISRDTARRLFASTTF